MSTGQIFAPGGQKRVNPPMQQRVHPAKSLNWLEIHFLYEVVLVKCNKAVVRYTEIKTYAVTAECIFPNLYMLNSKCQTGSALSHKPPSESIFVVR